MKSLKIKILPEGISHRIVGNKSEEKFTPFPCVLVLASATKIRVETPKGAKNVLKMDAEIIRVGAITEDGE